MNDLRQAAISSLALRNLRERKTGLYGPNVENSGRSETSARGSDLRADSNGV
jgi:hypothetical protein